MILLLLDVALFAAAAAVVDAVAVVVAPVVEDEIPGGTVEFAF